METVLENYLNNMQALQEIEIINEDLASFLKRFKPSKFKPAISDLKKAAAKKDIKKLERISKRIKAPRVSPDKLLLAGRKIHSDFRKNYKVAKMVLDNSLPKGSEESKKLAAIAISTKSIKNNEDVKETVKKFVFDARKMAAKDKSRIKMPRELLWEAVIGWTIIIAFIGAITVGAITAGLATSSIISAFVVLGILAAITHLLNIKYGSDEKSS
ncbi:MAG: hypothetical protein PVG65_01100 [Candidatus Thorarchaeota archaeon]|jgi:hypothetical protein